MIKDGEEEERGTERDGRKNRDRGDEEGGKSEWERKTI